MRLASFVAGSAALLALAAACTHSYDELEFRDSTSGGSGGTAQGGGSGKAGATGDASGGSAAGDGSATGGADGGKSDAGTTSRCPQFQIECGGSCVPGTDRARCGGCTNDCSKQGISGGLQCIDMRCGCQNAGQCGTGPTSHCGFTAGRCVCSGTQCHAGEACNNGACSCNGGPACAQNQICCVSGCATSC